MHKKKIHISSIVSKIILLLLACMFLYPFLWMFMTSLKDSAEALANPAALWPANGLHWENYVDVWNRLGFFQYFTNTLLATFGTVAAIIVIYTMAGFAFAKLKFKGSKALFVFFLSMMFVPGVTVTIPLYILVNSLGLVNTYLGLILPGINGAGPFAILLFTNYFKGISTELLESGIIDGAGYFRIYVQLFLPLAVPAIATIGIMNFLGTWNSFMWPMLVLTDKAKHTLPLALRALGNSAFVQWNTLMTGAIYNIIPLLIAFLFMQKYYIEGVTSGAIKM